uniref:Galactose mutarotase n=1 Tax=Timema cristinae TaxID=61476 RepID=A0A7R9H671_TIMCR|nr:unnamed protein product [Timema cristinae]
MVSLEKRHTKPSRVDRDESRFSDEHVKSESFNIFRVEITFITEHFIDTSDSSVDGLNLAQIAQRNFRKFGDLVVEHSISGIAMEVHADQPGVQFYTGNGLSNATVGKGSTPYSKHGAFCLETQNYPDAVNHANFPNSILNPGNTYIHKVIYKFIVRK